MYLWLHVHFILGSPDLRKELCLLLDLFGRAILDPVRVMLALKDFESFVNPMLTCSLERDRHRREDDECKRRKQSREQRKGVMRRSTYSSGEAS